MDNTSGQGKGAAVPDEVKGLCWGGFFWGAIWGIFNRVWLSLLGFVPVVGFVVHFVLLFKGREMAWRSKPWESVEHFNKVQRRWTIAAIIPVGLLILAIVAAVLLPVMLGGNTPPPPPKPAAMRPAAPKPAAPRPAPPKPVAPAPVAAAPETAPAPAASVASAPVLAPILTPLKSESAKTTTAAAGTGKAMAPVMPMRDSKAAPVEHEPTLANAQKSADPARTPRVRAILPPPGAVAKAAVPIAPVREPKIYTPRYNDVMTAVLRPDREGVIELLDLGRWVDKPDSNGTTPLEAAVRNRNTAMVELLLSRSANPNASSGNGVTPLSVARANGDAAMASLLQRHGAR